MRPDRAKYRIPFSVLLIYGIVGLVFLGAGAWLANDLITSRASILAERSALALQTSRFMSQQFGTTVTATDYVLRDVTTKVTVAELDAAGSDPEIQQQLSALVREKLATLPGVTGLAFLDQRCIFVAAADEHLIGFHSNTQPCVDPGQVLENRTYIEYVPASKSANKQPAILVSRPMLSSDGFFQSGALAAIVLSTAQDWIASFDIGEHDTLAMVDGEGILLAHHPSMPDAIGQVLQSSPDQPRFGDQRGSASFITVSPLDGREHIYGISKVENIPLNIIVSYDVADILREWQQRVWQSAVGFISLLVLLGLALRTHLDALAQRYEVQQLAITDPLTGVANRRQLMVAGEHEIAKAIRYKHPASVLMVDIDHFKSINDTWGHPTGDRVIQSCVQAMVSTIRNTDIVGRLGGEEFGVILTGTTSEGALTLATRLRDCIEHSVTVKSDSGAPVGFTVSIGVAGLDEEASSFEGLLGRADQALYEAKRRGRNNVVLAQVQSLNIA